MRVLVTGAAGFVGSHLCDRFLAEGHEVVGVDNLLTGRAENLRHLDGVGRFRFVHADVIQPLPAAVDGKLDWILHFACPASPPKYLAAPLETMRVCSEGTLHLLERARRDGGKLLLASTSEVYGDPLVHPQPESCWGNVNPIGPRSVYDEGKRYAEALVSAFHRTHGVGVRIVRIFNTYGPRMDPGDGRVVTNFVMQALRGEPLTIYGEGTQTRSFQYVDDLVDGVRRLLDVEHPGPVNVGNPEEFTMLELATLVRALTDSRSTLVHAPLPQDDPRQRRPDITLAKSLLGWSPKVTVRDGLARTIAHFRAHA